MSPRGMHYSLETKTDDPADPEVLGTESKQSCKQTLQGDSEGRLLHCYPRSWTRALWAQERQYHLLIAG